MISLVVPAHNEARNVSILAAEVAAVLGEKKVDYELIFVDDGSTDSTRDEIKAANKTDPHVRLVALKRNYGLTAALVAGIRASKGDVVVTMDADLQADPKDLPALLAALEGADAACGWRVNRNEGDGFVKVLSSRIANFVRVWITGHRSRDSGCTFRAIRRKCFERVKLFRGMHRFLPTLLEWEGFRIVEVPVQNRPRKFGVSKYGVWNRVFVTMVDVLVVRWMRSRIDRPEVAEEAG